jgi:tRNA pseudouridine55 synthase
MKDRVILIDKEPGYTSFEVIQQLKRRLKVRKIGHSGTLDMLASGLLIAATGRATKLTRYFLEQTKTYETVFTLGETTASNDRDSEVDSSSVVKKEHYENLDSALLKFQGSIVQTPPVYSAVKINGKRASDRTRAGEQLELKSRQVTINSIDVLEVNQKSSQIKLKILCSKGTYIRSLARDLGQTLGCGAVVDSLRRTKSGIFTVEDAVKIEDIDSEVIQKGCFNLNQSVEFMNRAIVLKEHEEMVLNGVRINFENLYQFENRDSNYNALFNQSGNLLGIAVLDKHKKQFKYLNVFN